MNSSIGLVLGGGGLAGYTYTVATLKCIADATGWDPRSADVIVGTSAGANAAGFLRADRSVDSLFSDLMEVPTKPAAMRRLKKVTGNRSDFKAIKPKPASAGLVGREIRRGLGVRPGRLIAGLAPAGPVSTGAIGSQMRELHPSWPSEELMITAVRLSDGTRVVFNGTQGTEVAEAVQASSAIPGFFKPVNIAGVDYIDGSIHAPTNADLLAGRDLDLVIVIAPMSVDSYSTGWTTPNGPLRLFWRNQVQREVELLEHSGQKYVLMEPTVGIARAMGVTMMDADRVMDIMHASTEAFSGTAGDDIRKKLSVKLHSAV